MNNKADIHNQLQALICSCIDEGDYDPAEDYVKDPFCRRTMHTASLAIEEIDALRARVAELEAERDKLLPMKRNLESAIGVRRSTADGVLILSEDAIVYTYEVLDARSRFTGRIIAMKYSRWRFVRYEELWPNRGVWAAPDGQWWCYSTEQAAARAANGEV